MYGEAPQQGWGPLRLWPHHCTSPKHQELAGRSGPGLCTSTCAAPYNCKAQLPGSSTHHRAARPAAERPHPPNSPFQHNTHTWASLLCAGSAERRSSVTTVRHAHVQMHAPEPQRPQLRAAPHHTAQHVQPVVTGEDTGATTDSVGVQRCEVWGLGGVRP